MSGHSKPHSRPADCCLQIAARLDNTSTTTSNGAATVNEKGSAHGHQGRSRAAGRRTQGQRLLVCCMYDDMLRYPCLCAGEREEEKKKAEKAAKKAQALAVKGIEK